MVFFLILNIGYYIREMPFGECDYPIFRLPCERFIIQNCVCDVVGAGPFEASNDFCDSDFGRN